MIRIFPVVNYMIRKFSFGTDVGTYMSWQTFSFTHFYQFENSFYLMKHDPEVKSFIHIGTFMMHRC